MNNEIIEVVINHNGRAFKYKFSEVCIEGGEFAREIGEFKAMQMQQPPQNVDSIIKSNGSDWLARSCAMLFNEYKNFSVVDGILTGDKVTFDFDRADSDIRKFFGTLPIEERPKLRQVIEDFFLNIGLGLTGSVLFQNRESNNVNLILQKLVEMTTNAKSKESESLETE